jgi:hypothetical protein
MCLFWFNPNVEYHRQNFSYNEQALMWNECTSKYLLLNSTTNIKMSYIGSGHGEDEIK